MAGCQSKQQQTQRSLWEQNLICNYSHMFNGLMSTMLPCSLRMAVITSVNKGLCQRIMEIILHGALHVYMFFLLWFKFFYVNFKFQTIMYTLFFFMIIPVKPFFPHSSCMILCPQSVTVLWVCIVKVDCWYDHSYHTHWWLGHERWELCIFSGINTHIFWMPAFICDFVGSKLRHHFTSHMSVANPKFAFENFWKS